MTDPYDDEDDLFELYHSSGNVRDLPRPSPEEDQNETPDVPEGSNSGSPIDDMDVHDLLVEGRKMLLQDLLKAVRGGYASPQEKAILAKMLKDNGMIMGDPLGGTSENRPAQKRELPTFTKPDYA